MRDQDLRFYIPDASRAIGDSAIGANAIGSTPNNLSGGISMTDIVFILVTVAFFAVAVVYTHGCDRL